MSTGLDTLITGTQIRMARAALKIGVRELAKMASVAPMTISRLENDQSGGYAETIRKIEAALTAVGVEFIETDRGEGVIRLRRS